MPDTVMQTADSTAAAASTARRWTREDILALFELPFMELLHRAHETHRQHHDPNKVQLSTLLNIKTGGCQEDCKYCAQSVKYDTGVGAEKLLDRAQVRAAAEKAKQAGAGRFCMGAAWRELKDRDVEKLANIVRDVKDLGLEACMTLGMLTRPQADALKDAGLDYYNHNLDTSEEFYEQIVSTHSYRDRLDTLANVRDAGLKVCSGGIVGLGESRVDRAGLLETLANLSPQPESVPINKLVSVAGTPLGGVDALDAFEFIRTIAVARILMPRSYVRLSAGRRSLSDEGQALCFYAGANSIFYGDKLLTTGNPEHEADRRLFDRLGLEADGGAH
ncbi:Biotin synthase (EC 2.8.1.6) [Azospirillum argentinense]|uniref:biotin synthase BioB n=1 Tax=Azospirillum argentinense TaxID=2970906 RepID=UPI003D81745F